MSQPKSSGYVVANAFDQFVRSQAFSGMLLVVCTIIALMLANSDYAHWYFNLNRMPLSIHLGHWGITKSLKLWINDGLMAIFFLLVGLEIKREMRHGELSTFRQALLPVVAAIGGMVVPAIIFIVFNRHDSIQLMGWAIPTATDIAFAIGILSLMSSRVPRKLVLMLTAIAIVDDIGAVLVIAIFYGHHLVPLAIIGAIVCVLILIGFNVLKVNRLLPYLVVGIVLWAFILCSGIHATIAGVILAFTIPGNATQGAVLFKKRFFQWVKDLKTGPDAELSKSAQKDMLASMKVMVDQETSLIEKLMHGLHLPVNLLIIPLFVLFNAGVRLDNIDIFHALNQPVTLGIILGLVIGKLIGISGSIGVMCWQGWAQLPSGINKMHVMAMSLMAGIGFTMSIFITELAYPNDVQLLTYAKVGILVASVLAALCGYLLLLLNGKVKSGGAA